MKQGFAIWLILGGLLALWLYNTGRVAAFKAFVLNAPGQATLPGGTTKTTSGPASADPAKVAACASAAAEGIITADCLSSFISGASNPGALVSSAVKTLTFGVVKL